MFASALEKVFPHRWLILLCERGLSILEMIRWNDEVKYPTKKKVREYKVSCFFSRLELQKDHKHCLLTREHWSFATGGYHG